MQVKGKDIINIVPPVPDPIEREKIWKTVVQTREPVRTQCYTKIDMPSNDDLFNYWSVNEETNKFESRTDLMKQTSIGTGQVYGQREH